MLPRLNLTAPLVFSLAVLLFGVFISQQFGLYAAWDQFDTFMHFIGGIAAAWLALALMQADIVRMAPWKQVLVLVSLAALAAVLWEFAEYMAGFGRDVVPWLWSWFHGGDLADTMLDLTAGLAGALLFSLWALRRERS
jgi:hypothetical protein